MVHWRVDPWWFEQCQAADAVTAAVFDRPPLRWFDRCIRGMLTDHQGIRVEPGSFAQKRQSKADKGRGIRGVEIDEIESRRRPALTQTAGKVQTDHLEATGVLSGLIRNSQVF